MTNIKNIRFERSILMKSHLTEFNKKMHHFLLQEALNLISYKNPDIGSYFCIFVFEQIVLKFIAHRNMDTAPLLIKYWVDKK